MAVADVLKMAKDNEIKFVDFRFTDTKGKEQHVSVPIKAFGKFVFTESLDRHGYMLLFALGIGKTEINKFDFVFFGHF